MTYIPKQGDIVWISLNPQLGHEQKGRRPSLIISNDEFNKITGMAMICPITNKDNGFPLHIRLQGYKTTGYVMVEHIKSLDYNARNIEYIEPLGFDDLTEILSLLNACF